MLKIYLLCTFLFANIISATINGYVAITEQINGTVDITPGSNLEKFGNSYYYFGEVYKGNYFQAMQFCHLHNMSLLSIESQEENENLAKHLKRRFGSNELRFWTSGKLLPDEQSWVWLSTGRRVTYTNWLPAQPNLTDKNLKCIEIRFSNNLKWTNVMCSGSKLVICEVTAIKDYSKTLSSVSNCSLTVINNTLE